jgi:LacI family transcriptional regulator, galactose operon repressor
MRRIAVLIESSRAYGRGLLHGVARYNREQGRWSVYLQPHGLDHPPPRWLNRWRGDGILVRIGDRRMLRAVLAAGLPTVDLRGVVPDLGVPFIGVDNRAVADMAADHLMERGLRHFGFCGLPAGVHPHLDERRRFFTARIERSGYEVNFYEAKAEQSTPWDREQKRMAAWIGRLPKPVGIMTCHDDRGLQALDACQAALVSVPDDVAIISVDDDELLCSMFTPQLTSIDVNPEGIGYRAAELLDRMMAGEPPARDPILLPPRAVVLRQSTDTLAVDDPRLPWPCATSAATHAKASALTTCWIRSTYRGVCWSGDSIASSADRPRPRSFASSSSERSSCSPRVTFRSMWWPANRGSETVATCAMSLPER